MTLDLPDESRLESDQFGAAALLPDADGAAEFALQFGYRIGRCQFVLQQELLTEIVVGATVFSIPHSPGWFRGVINLRGNIIPVLDLSAALDTQLHDADGEFILVIDKGREALGVVIDTMPVSLTNVQVDRPASDSPTSPFFSPGVYFQEIHWPQLDAKALARHLRERAGTHARDSDHKEA